MLPYAFAGAGLVVLMHALLLFAGSGRGPFYLASQAVALAGALAVAAGLALLARPRAGAAALAAGFAALASSRALMLALDLSRWPVSLNLLLVLAFALAALAGVLWALQPTQAEARARMLRFALSLLGVAHFIGMGLAVSSGRLSILLALMLGAVGYALAAPNIEAPAEADVRSRDSPGSAV